MKNAFLATWCFCLLAGLVLGLASLAVKSLDGPVVYRSWSTKECVKVEPETAGTCDDLPDLYEIVWVR